ncbi:TonB-dependent hemoglobin/transferrin/lactoferrin family receptor [Rhizobium sp. CFBP 8762]|uniref:TonB-dependent hemoglobin/transferrin/lactoferrin family receptor n=1 Tax=Rhizobium sp. CFBP 8762 TaxID=2775279 RepID=UPI00177FCB7D|nr:TonB-dependent hemoglobin/transferrin/lactoferrin family receptor [Rhizobium sp. CFBP 8762]MBD8556511.1 TonB-dependent hemoglobin/transferrin/lactoferrin family receptor [Rhizobium sp. CFBP 8762]
MSFRRSRAALLACSAVFVSVTLVQAQTVNPSSRQSGTQEGEAAVLDKVNVKGGRVGLANTPLATSATRSQLDANQVTAVDDISRTLDPGVNYSRLDNGFNIRGLSGARVLTVIDGIPIPYLSNDARSGAFSATNSNGGSDQFDFEGLSSLDIIRGADSSRVGSGALAGTVSLRTLEPEDLIFGNKTWGALLKSTYDYEDSSILGSAAYAQKISNTSVLLQTSYKNGSERRSQGTVGGYGALRTEPNPTDLDQRSVLFKVRQDLEGGHRIGVTAERFRRDIDTDQRTDQGSGRSYKTGNFKTFEERDRDRVSLDYDFQSPATDSLIDSIQTSIYWQKLRRSSGAVGTENSGAAYGRDNEAENRTFGVVGSAEKGFDLGGYTHALTVAYDAAFGDWTQFTAGVCPTPTTCPRVANQSEVSTVDTVKLGLSINDRISIGNSAFAVTPGVRFDWFRYEPKESSGFSNNPARRQFGLPGSTDGFRISPKVLFTYDLNPGVQLFTQVSTAFRAPTVDELYGVFYNERQKYASIGNPELEPETGYGIEAGANIGDEDTGGRAAFFYNKYDNFIDRKTSTVNGISEMRNFNVNNVRISGLEVNAYKTFQNGIHLHGAIAYASGLNTDTRVRRRDVAPVKAIVGVGYRADEWGADASLVAAANVNNDQKPTTFDAPGYGVVDLTAWWTPAKFAGLKVQGGVYNVFDKEYYNGLNLRDLDLTRSSTQPRSYYSEPGRTFKVSIAKQF